MQLLNQTQWWSNLSTQWLQREQCFDRAGFSNLQVLHSLLLLKIIWSYLYLYLAMSESFLSLIIPGLE